MPRKKLPIRKEVYKDHRVAQLWGIEDINLMTDQGQLIDKLHSIALQLKLTVVETFSHQFAPHGLSVILVIAESHMAVHTWPEYGYMHIDVFTCSDKTNIKSLKAVLKKEIPSIRISVGKISYD